MKIYKKKVNATPPERKTGKRPQQHQKKEKSLGAIGPTGWRKNKHNRTYRLKYYDIIRRVLRGKAGGGTVFKNEGQRTTALPEKKGKSC